MLVTAAIGALDVSNAAGAMRSANEIRHTQRSRRARLAGGWEKCDPIIMDVAPVGTAMIERLDVAEDQQHLDIASVTGEAGWSIARLVSRAASC